MLAGIYLRNATGTVRDTTVTGVRVPGGPSCDSGVGIYIESGKIGEHLGVTSYGRANVTVKDVNVSGCQKGGIAANGVKTTVRVSRGTFTGDPTSGAVSNGIQVGYGAKARLGQPTIRDYVSGALDQTATGILLFRAARVSVRKPKIDDVQTGIFVVGNGFVHRAELTNIVSDGIVVLGDGNRLDYNSIDGAGVSGIFIAGNRNAVVSGYLANMPVGLWFYSGIANGWVGVHFASSVPLHGQGVYGGQRDLTEAAASPFQPDCATDADCDDGSACTIDTCDPVTRTCVATPACDDGNPCTDDACDVSGCTHVYNSAPCEDGDACTTNDTCVNGVCTQGVSVDCNDGDPCTTDACSSTLGCVHGSVCDDGDPCTTDTCDSVNGCSHAPDPCDDSNACTTDTCDPVGGCQHAAVADGSLCPGGSCLGGVCGQ